MPKDRFLRFGGLPGMLRRLPVTAKLGLGFMVLIALVGVFAPLLLTKDPAQVALAPPTQGPSSDYWFGVDRLGRDVFSRLVDGTRRSLIVGFGASGLALLAGGALGATAATGRRVVDEIIMRILDVVMAFPTIVLAAVLVIAYGKDSLLVLVLAIAFVFMPQMARIVRANVQAQYGEDYVSAERVIGAGRRHILTRHVIRNCAAPIMVFATVMVANAIVFEASMSFIGAGLQGQDSTASWGSVIAYGQQLLAAHGWWATFFPGVVILLSVLALNMLSEGISDVFAAPAAQRGRTPAKAKDPIEEARPGSGEIAPLPGLAEAAERLAGRARPLPDGAPVLSVRDLRIGFPNRHQGVDIVAGVSFDVRPGEVLGLVGESGCGKSLTALTIAGLQAPGTRISGSIEFDGQNLLGLSRTARRRLMGTDIAMIYQDALSALNPAMTIGAQLRQLTRRGGTSTPEELLDMVGLNPARTIKSYPHELSGGQRQRVVISMALSRSPRLIIADEPTTALDVTVQAQVVSLLLRLREEHGFSLVFVSHDLALVSQITDRVVVMYGGQVAERGATPQVLAAPQHHYARGLLASVLSLEAAQQRLSQVHGVVPSPADFPAGCRFSDRCPVATSVCRTDVPVMTGPVDQHAFACHHPAEAVLARPDLQEVRRG